MKLVVFGLTISSSWGNGHATLWRGLLRALIAHGHEVVFYEKNAAYYREHRDLWELPPGGRLVIYESWNEVRPKATTDVLESDASIVTSYCPDAQAATDLMFECAPGWRVFYDLDTPVTLARLEAGEKVNYLPIQGLGGFDLVLSFTGGKALDELQTRLGARRVAPLYGSVDPEVHRITRPAKQYVSDLSYLGTYAENRQAALNTLFVEPARLCPHHRFLIGGTLYPPEFPWSANIYFVHHVPPGQHGPFFCSSRLTLNVTREPMAAMGYCPSGRLFEAAACGVPVVSDAWEGLDDFFRPNHEIIVAESSDDVLQALEISDEERKKMGLAAQERVLAEHTADQRARQLEALLTPAAVSVEG